MIIEWDTAWNLGSVSSETVNSGITPLQIIGVIFGVVGLVFFLGAAVGMVRFPDFYTRMHAAGKRRHSFHHANAGRIRALHDGGFSLNSWLILLKILSVVLFIYLTSPTSSHALMRAAFEDDEMPLTEEDLKKSSRKKRRKKK